LNIYLDSARVGSWTLPAGCPPVRGVTTNPTLVHQAGMSVTLDSYEALLQAVADHGMAELMLQLPMSDPAEARHWQDRLHTRAQHVGVQLTIKLPCRPDWLAVIHAMREAAQPVLLTGLSNPVQLLWAHALNVAFVAPYIGRLAADGRDVWPLMQACVALQADKGPALLAASIKSPEVLARLIACGAAAVTLPPESLVAWAGDALTDTAIAQFARDTAASQSHPPPAP
jgi:transaldolase